MPLRKRQEIQEMLWEKQLKNPDRPKSGREEKSPVQAPAKACDGSVNENGCLKGFRRTSQKPEFQAAWG